MNSTFRSLALAALTLCAINAHAAGQNPGNSAPGFHAVLGTDLTFGGDKISTMEYSDGSSVDIRGGGTMQVGGGVAWNSADMPISAQATINYHFDQANAKNGSVKFQRFPIEGLVFYTGLPNWRFGGGVRFVQSPEYSGGIDGVGSSSVSFKSTTGAVVEAGYMFSPGNWVSARYVSEKYTVNSANYLGAKIDGSHFGIGYQYEFH